MEIQDLVKACLGLSTTNGGGRQERFNQTLAFEKTENDSSFSVSVDDDGINITMDGVSYVINNAILVARLLCDLTGTDAKAELAALAAGFATVKAAKVAGISSTPEIPEAVLNHIGKIGGSTIVKGRKGRYSFILAPADAAKIPLLLAEGFTLVSSGLTGQMNLSVTVQVIE